MLKGHTKIELTDTKTGEVEVIEDDNMITGAVASLLTYKFGVMLPNQQISIEEDYTDDRNAGIAPRFFGGLLLFDKPLAEEATTIYPPDGVKMVGNGAYKVSTTDNAEFGSYNSQESFIKQEGTSVTTKFVWDFGTSQGNGKIACVCLGTFWAGAKGFGNSTSNKRLTQINVDLGTKHYPILKTNIGFYDDIRSSDGGYTANSTPLYICVVSRGVNARLPMYSTESGHEQYYSVSFANYNTNTIYSIPQRVNTSSRTDTWVTKQGGLLIAKTYFPFKSYNPLIGLPLTAGTIPTAVDETVVPIPDELANFFADTTFSETCRENSITFAPDVDGDGVWGLMGVVTGTTGVVYNTYLTTAQAAMVTAYTEDNTLYLWHINSKLESTVYEMPSPKGLYLYVSDAFHSGNHTRFFVYKGYLYISGVVTSEGTVTFNRFTRSGTTAVVVSSWEAVNCPGIYRIEIANPTNVEKVLDSDGITMTNYGIYFVTRHHRLYTYSDNLNLVDSCNYIIDAVNNTAYTCNGNLRGHSLNASILNDPYDDIGTGATSFHIRPCTDALTTINNLGTPVTKTADKTMKVTYTLISDLDMEEPEQS